MLFNGRHDTIALADDYGSIILEANRKVAKEPKKEKIKNNS